LHVEHEEETTHAEAPDPALYMPPTIGHAERVARGLIGRYRKKTLSECQHAVARMYGHASWTLLQSSLAVGAAASRYDEDETSNVVHARRERHRDVTLVWLAGVNEESGRAARSLDQLLLGHGAHTISQRYDPSYNQKRIDRARHAYNIAYAHHVVAELRPTGREPLDIPRNDDEVDLALRVDLLPRALKSWLAHHRPLLDRWGVMLGDMPVRQRCPTELLDFSFAWGELCLLHGADIPKALQVYPIALCAQWYAWLACLAAPSLRKDIAVLESAGADDELRKRSQQAMQQAIREEEERFLLAQPREDLRTLSASARQQQMHAGYAVLRRAMSDAAAEYTIKAILAKPSLAPLSPLAAAR
jgi:hypothetical protein